MQIIEAWCTPGRIFFCFCSALRLRKDYLNPILSWLKLGFLSLGKWFYFWLLLILRSSLSTIKIESTSQWFLNSNCYLWSLERLLKVHLCFSFSQHLLQEKNAAKDRCHFSMFSFSLRSCPLMVTLLWYLSNYFKHILFLQYFIMRIFRHKQNIKVFTVNSHIPIDQII